MLVLTSKGKNELGQHLNDKIFNPLPPNHQQTSYWSASTWNGLPGCPWQDEA